MEEVKQDGQYVLYDNGIVYDENTKLEWVVGPDGDTNWDEAKRWVEKLSLAGGGWRMPTRKELGCLYEKNNGTRNMTPLLMTTGTWVWSGETEGSSDAWGFNFYGGNEGRPARCCYRLNRAFAVRSRK
jgi:hypothetical protein